MKKIRERSVFVMLRSVLNPVLFGVILGGMIGWCWVRWLAGSLD